MALPDELHESSGVAVSTAHPGVFWSHNDSNNPPILYALDASGRVLARIGLSARPRDWEDMALAPCAAGRCIYLGDIGNNHLRRRHLVLYRLPEPAIRDTSGLHADAFPMTLPDGPHDIEALFVLPGENVYFVSKGRRHPVEVYRYPPPLRPDTVLLEPVQSLTAAPPSVPDWVTGADASADGGLVAVRTYRSLRFYRMREGRLEQIEDGLVNLMPLQETQGEAVALGPDGLVVLTSEAGPLEGPPGMVFMRCRGL